MKKTPTKRSRELVLITAGVVTSLPVSACCTRLLHLLNNAEDLLLLWKRLCREPPAVLCVCERWTLGKLCSQFSRFYPEVMSENGLTNSGGVFSLEGSWADGSESNLTHTPPETIHTFSYSPLLRSQIPRWILCNRRKMQLPKRVLSHLMWKILQLKIFRRFVETPAKGWVWIFLHS